MNRSHRGSPHALSCHAPTDPFAGLAAGAAGSPLSEAGSARSEEILADLVSRAPRIRRARTARRLALRSAPIALLLLAAFTTRSLWRHTPAPSPSGPIALAPAVEPDAPDPVVETNASESAPRLIRVVSTAGRSYADRIVAPGDRPAAAGGLVMETIDDEALMRLLAREGHAEGIVRVGDRAMLASDLAPPNPAAPSGGSPMRLLIPADGPSRGL